MLLFSDFAFDFKANLPFRFGRGIWLWTSPQEFLEANDLALSPEEQGERNAEISMALPGYGLPTGIVNCCMLTRPSERVGIETDASVDRALLLGSFRLLFPSTIN
ncbi:MAG: hypothetical protein WBV39_14620, partial [Rudaea sp.]